MSSSRGARSDVPSGAASIDINYDGPEQRSGRSRRPASVYDAVARRVASDRFIPEEASIPTTRDTAKSSSVPIPPQEVLFKSQKAPSYLYEETNPYFGDLPDDLDQAIPESDLLKAIHAYAADFYSRTLDEEEAEVTYESLDGSALLALGILLEETCKEVVGDTGDLALVEGIETENEGSDFGPPKGPKASLSPIDSEASKGQSDPAESNFS